MGYEETVEVFRMLEIAPSRKTRRACEAGDTTAGFVQLLWSIIIV